MSTRSGVFVISLDFELKWGVRHRPVHRAYHANLYGARESIPRILATFGEFDVAATWATVGFLFARSRQERERYAPRIKPTYSDPRLSAYNELTGSNEFDDPLHYAPSLIETIQATPRQEIATHTFSHYFTRERGQYSDAFRADLQAAQAIAATYGLHLTSIVFPRNQRNPDYDRVLLDCGITAYRGNPSSRMWRFADSEDADRPVKRVTRLLDAYLTIDGHNTQSWQSVAQPNGLCDVRASTFLRPYDPRFAALEPLRLRRVVQSMQRAAEHNELFHLWWHPHNFGRHIDENLAMLRSILKAYARCRERWGMESLTMANVAWRARQQPAGPSDVRLDTPQPQPAATLR